VNLLKAAVAYGSASMIGVTPVIAASRDLQTSEQLGTDEKVSHLADTPLSDENTVTVERRGQIVLIGINRTKVFNRVDPRTYVALARAYYDCDHDPSLRAAVLFGHGEHFSRGIDVDAYKAAADSNKPLLPDTETIDPLGKRKPHLTKPLIAVTHGDTWNMGHELHLVADIRIAARNTDFGQDENTHGRFPGGGSTVRFVSEVGWSNAMWYMLTGDHWSADEAYRLGEVQTVAATQQDALRIGIEIAAKVAAYAPLGIKATLASSHLSVDAQREVVFAQLSAQYASRCITLRIFSKVAKRRQSIVLPSIRASDL